MLSPRYSIVGSMFFWLFLASLLSFAVGFGVLELGQPQIYALGASALSFFIMSSVLLLKKIHIPLNRVVREMKALLTGKSYRRIMTRKENELGVMAHFFNQVTKNLESISGDVKSHERIQKELNTAQKIQRDLLPESAPHVPGLDITARTRPASEIGGDTFDFYVQENRTLLYIGDSTGHGVPAGIVMVMVDTLLETFIDLVDDLKSIIVNLNKYLKPHLQTTMFMTMIFAEWIPAESKLSWVGCGHEYLVHYSPSTGVVTSIPSGGIAVGMVPDNTALVKEQSLVMAENDFMIFFTDGITEAKNVQGEIYGLERLETFVKSYAGADVSTEDLFEKIAIDVGRFMNGHEQEDDMTLIVMKRSVQVQSGDKSTEWTDPTNEESVAAPAAPASTAPAQ